MKAISKYYLPNLCISFTVVVICCSVINLVNHNDPNGFQRFILQLAIFLIIAGFIDYLLGKIPFRSWLTYLSLQFIINYGLLLPTGYLFNWFGFRTGNLLLITLVFISTCLLITFHSYILMKQDEKMLNKLINQRNNITH